MHLGGQQEIRWPRPIGWPGGCCPSLYRHLWGCTSDWVGQEAQLGQGWTSLTLPLGPAGSLGRLLLMATVQEQKGHQNHEGLLRSVFSTGSGTLSLPPHSVGPSRSHGWAQTQGEGMKPSSLQKHMTKGMDRRRGKKWGHYHNQTQRLSTCDVGGLVLVLIECKLHMGRTFVSFVYRRVLKTRQWHIINI